MPTAAPTGESPHTGDPLVGTAVGDTRIVRLIGMSGRGRVY